MLRSRTHTDSPNCSLPHIAMHSSLPAPLARHTTVTKIPRAQAAVAHPRTPSYMYPSTRHCCTRKSRRPRLRPSRTAACKSLRAPRAAGSRASRSQASATLRSLARTRLRSTLRPRTRASSPCCSPPRTQIHTLLPAPPGRHTAATAIPHARAEAACACSCWRCNPPDQSRSLNTAGHRIHHRSRTGTCTRRTSPGIARA